MDFSKTQDFQDQKGAFRALQESGFRLWQWLDHSTTVWWGPGRTRVLLQQQSDGSLRTAWLPPLRWEEARERVGTVAGYGVVEDLMQQHESSR